eukprot:TRINITY_DN4225_c0_g1_i1.p1 TRINITY_DN4225_c0_g1~~TRINITY_DN4225_c0_g1_i1.p1  ORF type:complete len:475 (-),score=170.23 TRINITY_DN4225_c0_g1_i1:29-1453(-)
MNLDLEQIRSLNEDIERLQNTAAKVLTPLPKSNRETLYQDHIVYALREKIIEKKRKLNELYGEFQNSERKKKLEEMKGNGPQAFEQFFSKVREIKEFYENNSNIPSSHQYLELENPKMPEINFSTEENNGKYLDLYEFYEIFINTKFFKNRPNFEKLVADFTYRTYVSSFFEFTAEKGKDEEYKNYLQKLTDYICSFIKRKKPLFPVEKTLKTIESESEEQWNSGAFVSWDLETESKVEENDPLHCKTCKKKFANENVMTHHLLSKKHLTLEKRFGLKKSKEDIFQKEIFLMEVRINRLADEISSVISETISSIEKKQARTLRELREAQDESSSEVEDDSDEEEEVAKQIKNYPVGFDGEPIPYWLYKLHGLGVEYKCEICGNASYMGRKAFELHFQDWKHQFGMKCLGIPNTKDFQEITIIKDAQILYEKILERNRKINSNNEEIEVEDQEGNIYTERIPQDGRFLKKNTNFY